MISFEPRILKQKSLTCRRVCQKESRCSELQCSNWGRPWQLLESGLSVLRPFLCSDIGKWWKRRRTAAERSSSIRPQTPSSWSDSRTIPPRPLPLPCKKTVPNPVLAGTCFALRGHSPFPTTISRSAREPLEFPAARAGCWRSQSTGSTPCLRHMPELCWHFHQLQEICRNSCCTPVGRLPSQEPVHWIDDYLK